VRKAACLALGLGAAHMAGAAAAPSPVAALAGQYSDRFQNALVSGETYFSDDIVEIVPVDSRHAYVDFDLNFYNGHTCGLTGIAAAQDGALVYREPADKALSGHDRCVLTIRRKRGRLIWDDGGTCQAYCGERGTFSGGYMLWSSKMPVPDLARLRRSAEYRRALAEWRTGHAQP